MFNFFRRKKHKTSSESPERLLSQLHTIEKISFLITSGLPLEESLNQITKAIPSVVEVSLAAVLLANTEEKVLSLERTSIPRAARIFVETATGKKVQDILYPYSDVNNIFHKAIESKSIQTTKDITQTLTPLMSTPKANALVNIVKSQISSLVVVPMIIQGEVIGVLALGWKQKEITEHEIGILSTFSNQAAIVIQNSRLYDQIQQQVHDLERRNSELESMAKFTNNIITTLDSVELPQLILDSISKIYNYTTSAYLRFDNESKKLRPIAITKSKFAQTALNLLPKEANEYIFDTEDPDLQDTAIVKAIKEDRIVLTDDFNNIGKKVLPYKLNTQIQKVLNLKSIVVIPIKSRNQIHGILCIAIKDRTIDEITTYEFSSISIIANQVGIAAENSELYNKIQSQKKNLTERNKQLEVITKFTNSIITDLETEKVSQNALDNIYKILGYTGGIFTKYEQSGNSLRVFKYTNNRFSKLGFSLIEQKHPQDLFVNLNNPNVSDNLTVITFKEDRILVSDNLYDISKGFVPENISYLIQKALGIKSLVTIPVKTQDRIIGVLTYFIQSKSPAEITELELDTLAIVTGQIGIALNNAELYSQVHSALEEAWQANTLLKQKYQEERDIIGILGHELRTPLSIAKNGLELLVDKVNKNKVIEPVYLKKKLNSIYEAIIRESRIVQTALSTTHVDNDKVNLIKTFINVEELILDYGIRPHKKEASLKGISLFYEQSENIIPEVYTDETKLQEVITNLISNAVKYTSSGHVRVFLKVKKEKLYINVEDTGMGIPKDELPRLGGRFHRVHQYTQNADNNIVRPGGTGLGLYIIKAYLKAMGGTLKVKSELGHGSTFTAVIPIKDNEPDENKTVVDETDLFVQYGMGNSKNNR